jgi:ATP-binding cassette, subfamily B, beta-glucan exporter
MADAQTFFHTYARALSLQSTERRSVALLSLANVAVASLFFVEPILFGRLIDLLTGAATHPVEGIWRASLITLCAWGAVGVSGIFANFLLALNADRLAHRRRLALTVSYFEHVLALSFEFHSDKHSARLLRTMLRATAYLFGFWLAFFQGASRYDHYANGSAAAVDVPELAARTVVDPVHDSVHRIHCIRHPQDRDGAGGR